MTPWQAFLHPRRASASLASLEASLAQAGADLAAERDRTSALQASLAAVSARCECLETSLEQARSQLDAQQDKMEEIARTFTLLEQKHETYLRRIAELRHRVAHLSRRQAASPPLLTEAEGIAPVEPTPQAHPGADASAPPLPPETPEASDWYTPPPELST